MRRLVMQHGRIDRGRIDARHFHAFRIELLMEAAEKAAQAELRGGIGRAVFQRQDAAERYGRHHGAFPPCLHHGRDGTHQPDGRSQIDLEMSIDDVHLQRVHRSRQSDTGIVHQRMEIGVLLRDMRTEPFDIRAIRQIAGDDLRRGEEGRNRAADGLLFPVHQNELHALTIEQARNRLPDAACRACYQCLAAG